MNRVGTWVLSMHTRSDMIVPVHGFWSVTQTLLQLEVPPFVVIKLAPHIRHAKSYSLYKLSIIQYKEARQSRVDLNSL